MNAESAAAGAAWVGAVLGALALLLSMTANARISDCDHTTEQTPTIVVVVPMPPKAKVM